MDEDSEEQERLEAVMEQEEYSHSRQLSQATQDSVINDSGVIPGTPPGKRVSSSPPLLLPTISICLFRYSLSPPSLESWTYSQATHLKCWHQIQMKNMTEEFHIHTHTHRHVYVTRTSITYSFLYLLYHP